MAKARKFGTFGGVFTPSILTILGVIMYMRLPMIIGEAGLVGALGIIFIAHLISITTGLSVSSIATDKKVKEGGTYYIISRSLGLPIGGTLGLALFVGLSFSVSLYLIGFSESFLSYWDMPIDINHIRLAGSIILLAVTIITFISTSLAIKTQYIIMAAIVLSLLSILFGNHDFAPATPNFFGSGKGISLMVLFGIFFPAVTGFEAGVSMSGDLKDPKKSIPLGTISAIAIGLVVYIGLVFFFVYTVDGQLLANDKQVLFKIALVPQLVIAGIWGATLSSALGSILAAPRILQSTAIDKITHRFFAKGTGASNEPRNALLLTFVIAEIGILIGELDVIARIVSIFFITTYGFLNLSAAFESLTSADFRPSFKTPAWVSIIGSLACILVMIQLDLFALIGAIVILGLVFLLLKRRQLVLETGDAWTSVWATLARKSLSKLNKTEMHSRNWRPNIILFSGKGPARPYLVELAKAFSGRHGIFSAFEMVETKEPILIKDQRYFSTGIKDEFQIHQHKCSDIFEGMNEIARIYGFSGVEPNTILMGWSKNEKNKDRFLRLIQSFEKSEFNSIFLNYNPLKKFGNKKTIDVWWSGSDNNIIFSIFLLRHFTSTGDWKYAAIRLLVINNIQSQTESIYRSLQHILNYYRINFEIKIINNSIDGLSEQEIISRESAKTDLTFIDLPDKRFKQEDKLYADSLKLSENIGTFLLVNGSSSFETLNLVSEVTNKYDKTSVQTEMLRLPEILPSKYHIIKEDIDKIDINGQKILNLFVERAFAPVIVEMQKVTDDLIAAINVVFMQTVKMEALDDSYRRAKSLIKIKNDFYFRTNRIFTDLATTKIDLQQRALDHGISWYINQLDEDLLNFPLKLEIPYETKDFLVKSGDSFGLKLFKFRKRIVHPFSKKTINGNIRYHKIATFYLRNNRHLFLSAFLEKFQDDIFTQLSESRTVINSVDLLLEKLLLKISQKAEFNEVLKSEQKSIAEKIREMKAGLIAFKDQIGYRLMVEFRKNLQLMSDEMGEVDINFRIGIKGRHKSVYSELIEKNTGFASLWYENTLHQVNKTHMDILLKSVKSRINDKINELNLSVTQQIDMLYIKELKAVRTKLEKFSEEPGEIPKLKISSSSFEENITLLDDFDKFGKEILKQIDVLPESMIVASYSLDDVSFEKTLDSLKVPLRKITRFYIESRFLGVVHDQLEKVSQSLKNSIFVVQELLSLIRFNLENIPADLSEREQLILPIINEASRKILKEEEKITKLKNSIIVIIDNLLQEVFNQLSGYKINSTVSEYSVFIGEHHGKRVIKSFDALVSNTFHFFKHLTAQLWYSRSEGINMAKQILETEQNGSVNQKILRLVDSVIPNDKVRENLPQFYKNLFSSRSSISEDFWIKRELDEEMVQTALSRYRSGYHGGIMILGERNSGKTTFCRHVTDEFYKKDKIFHLFSSSKCSSQVADFLNELRKVTNTTGNIDEMMESIPQGSVIIIHDLELWWKQSSDGWDVIRFIMKIINDYSKKVLFIVNMNPYAFELINKMVDLQQVLIDVIPLRPFDSRELQEMIMRRHRSSGLVLVLNKREINELSEIRMANLFNKYFDFSDGNPGTALNAWLGNIIKVADQHIYMKFPFLPDNRVFSTIEEEWKVVLIQMILSKRLSSERIQEIFLNDEGKANEIIKSLSRTGLIEQRMKGIYQVNGFVVPHLIREFKREGSL